MTQLVSVADVEQSGVLSSLGDLSAEQQQALDAYLLDAQGVLQDYLNYGLASEERTEPVTWYHAGREQVQVSASVVEERTIWKAFVSRQPVTSVATADVFSRFNIVAAYGGTRPLPEVTYTAGYSPVSSSISGVPVLPRALQVFIMHLAAYWLLASGDGSLFQRKVIQLPGGQATINYADQKYISRLKSRVPVKYKQLVV